MCVYIYIYIYIYIYTHKGIRIWPRRYPLHGDLTTIPPTILSNKQLISPLWQGGGDGLAP